MGTSRRSFMGITLGTIIGTGLPFIARPEPPTWEKLVEPDLRTRTDLFVDFLLAPRETQMKYHLGITIENSEHILGTTFKDIIQTNNGAEIIADGVLMNRELTCNGLIFRTPQGQLISTPRYTYAQRVYKSDTLKNTYRIEIT